ncbi:MAG: BspA family leucine-rich repeat surface protein [Prevotella sp.]|nr:BspA family leucine-rich repeat surface protein [Prevotella sp.]
MKQLRFLLVAMMTVVNTVSVQAQEAYAVVTMEYGNPTSVAFYYDTNKSSFVGTDVTIVDDLNAADVYSRWTSTALTSVTFEASFKNYTGLTSLYRWFYYCSALTEIDLSNLNVTNVTRCDEMFYYCSNLETIYAAAGTDWSSGSITISSSMFNFCSKLVGGALTPYHQNAVNIDYAHIDGGPGNPGYFTDPEAPMAYAAVTMNADNKPTAVTFYYDKQKDMHQGVTIVRNLNKEHSWTGYTLTSATFEASFAGVSTLTNLSFWFNNCSALASISGLEYLNTSNVTTMQNMFSSCTSLTELDLTGFDISNLVNTNQMFYGCSNLDAIYASGNWATDKITDSSDMFGVCNNLVGSSGTVYDSSGGSDKSRAHVDGGPTNPGYFSQRGVPLAYAAVEKNADGNAVAVTFYYDTQKDSRAAEGKAIVRTLNSSTVYLNWAGSTNGQTLTSATFDPSFKSYTGLTNLFRWFENCKVLTSITGLENLSTPNVTTTGSMFSSSNALTELDLTALNTSSVTDMSYMFSYATNLQTIYVDDNWTISADANTSSMFLSCSALVGGRGTLFNSSKTDGTMAHIDGGTADPGYLSRKGDPVAYAVVTKNADSKPVAVTFYYDTQKYSRTVDNTTIVTRLNSNVAYKEWADVTLTSASFDPSFASYHDLTSLYQWFYWCSALTGITGLEYLNTENVTTMYNMFYSCEALTELDLTHFDVSKVQNSYQMFAQCTNLETIYATSDWNTETNTQSFYMFLRCPKLMGGAMTAYDASHTDMAYAHPDGGIANPGYFTDPNAPRPYAVVTKNADSKPVAVAFYYDTNMDSHRADDVTILRALNGSTIATGWTGATLTSVTFDDSFANFHGLTTLNGWFSSCSALTSIDLSNLNTENVTTMQSMFYNCSGLTELDISGFDTENVTTMQGMFSSCSSFTELDLSGFDMTKVTNTQGMFSYCSNLETIYVLAGTDWTGATITSSSNMFGNCQKLVGGYGTVFSNTAYDKTRACVDGLDGKPGYFTVKGTARPYAIITSTTVDDVTTSAVTFYYDTELATRRAANPDATIVFKLNSTDSTPAWATASLTSATFDTSFATYKGLTGLANWFSGCRVLATINGISNLNTENVTTMKSMFGNCSSLTELDLSGFNTENVTTMYYMFYYCSALTELNLSTFNTTKVMDANWMFSGCRNLITIYAAPGTSWNTETLTSHSYMFQNCSNLVGGNGTTWNSSYITKTRACIDGLDGNPGYFTDKNAPRPYAILSADQTAITFYYDTQLPVRKAAPENAGATIILNLNPGSQPVWATSALTSATFDPSFAGFTGITSLYSWFDGCTGLTAIDLSNLNAVNVLNTSRMFYGCSNIKTITLGEHFSTAQVTNMNSMFYNCTNLETITLGEHFSTAQVTTMNSMFYCCRNLKAITFGSQFTTANVTDMSFMFYYCSSLTELDLSGFNTAKVTTMFYMFYGCSKLETIYAAANADWNTQTLTNSSYMFQDCTKLVGGNGTCYENSFNSYNQTRACIDGLNGKPGYFTDKTQPRPYAVVTKNADSKPVAVEFYYDTNMNSHRADDITIIRALNDASVATDWTGATLTSVTFDDSFTSYKGLTGLANWFKNCSGLTSIDLSNLNTENVTSMHYLFYGCSGLTELDLSGFNTENVTTMQYMFSGCSGLTELDLSGFNTENVTTMYYMFSNCTNLQTITFGPQFTTANVTEMSSMFSNCSALTELDLSTFTIEKVTSAYSVFQQCSNLKTIYAKAGTDWSTSTTISDSSNMFFGCTSLVGGKGTSYTPSPSYWDKTYARIDGLNDQPGYFTDPAAFLLGDVNKDGSITIDDVTALVSIILGKDNSGTYDKRAADVNKDSTITIADVTALVNIIQEKQ